MVVASSSGDTLTSVAMERERDTVSTDIDIHNVSVKIKRAKDVYEEFGEVEEQPNNGEIVLWYMYELCSYLVYTVLIPIVFPLIISQTVSLPQQPLPGWNMTACSEKQMKVYQGLTHPSLTIKDFKFSTLDLTTFSWAAGIILAIPILAYLSPHLDHGQKQPLIFGGATAIGFLFCLPVGFFRVPWIIPLYIAVIVMASLVATAAHTRYLGLMLRGFTNFTTQDSKFPQRRTVSSWLSLHATAAGSLGAGIISAFTFHMLHYREKNTSLWVVSIFSGLIWVIGTVHAFSANRPGSTTLSNSSTWSHVFSLFKHPHTVGSLISVFISSFTSTCIFTGGMLHIVGQLCFKPVFLLFIWLIYFIFPLLSLPLLHPLQVLIKIDAMQMQTLGLFVSATTSGFGFYFRHEKWRQHHILLMVALQGTATGILHAFGRALLLDCTPARKEGAFSAWFAWVRALGACVGFAVASAFPGNVSRVFSTTFCTAIAGMLILIFGNISSYGGAVAAGHVTEEVSEKGSPLHGLDTSGEGKGLEYVESREEGRAQTQ